MSVSLRSLLAAAALVTALAACDDPYSVDAQLDVVSDTLVLYGINDAPTGYPTAFSLIGAATGTGQVAASPTFAFDFAVDVRGDGTVALIPNSRLAGGVPTQAVPYRVGLQRIAGTFESATRAPISGYQQDSVFVVRPGEGVLVESVNPAACPVAIFGTTIYGKVVVDSVRAAPARVFLRSVVDPNCGFRSLVPGRPEE